MMNDDDDDDDGRCQSSHCVKISSWVMFEWSPSGESDARMEDSGEPNERIHNPLFSESFVSRGWYYHVHACVHTNKEISFTFNILKFSGELTTPFLQSE